MLIALLRFLLGKKTKQFVLERYETVKTTIESVSRQLTGAQAKFSDFTTKLQQSTQEAEGLKKQAAQDAESLKKKIIENAKKSSQVLLQDANEFKASKSGELKKAISSELGARIVAEAETLIRKRLTGEVKTKIRRDFASQVERLT